ncbi:glycosyltransferase [Brevibacterium sp. PAMC21349]|nr:glycosyltransferase [Brevibacterium sp. PAMC21349]
MSGKVHVITAVHNRYSITEKFVVNLLQQTYPSVHLVLVDDGSTDGTSKMVMKYLPDTTIIQGNGNLWWGGALHEAYKWICKNADTDDYVMISNDDVDIDSNYINLALAKLRGRDNVLVSGFGISKNTGEIMDAPIAWDFAKCSGKPVYSGVQNANCVSTRSLFMKVGTLNFVGGFHPVLLPHYASDYEWTIRAVRKGCVIETYRDLTYLFDEGTTGIRNRKKANLKLIFSKKSNFNPIFRFSFIILVTPLKSIPMALWYQFRRIIKL